MSCGPTVVETSAVQGYHVARRMQEPLSKSVRRMRAPRGQLAQATRRQLQRVLGSRRRRFAIGLADGDDHAIALSGLNCTAAKVLYILLQPRSGAGAPHTNPVLARHEHDVASRKVT